MQHPDHTGSSSNPLAPWNAPDATEVECAVCGDLIILRGDADEDEDYVCVSCEGDDARDEHDPSL